MASVLLLVDDSPSILETAKDILEAEDFQVLTATTGASALSILREQAVALMIADFNLPDTTGVSLSMQARQIQPTLPILLMTGEARVELGAAEGVVIGVLAKPVHPQTFLEKIRQAIGSHGLPPHA